MRLPPRLPRVRANAPRWTGLHWKGPASSCVQTATPRLRSQRVGLFNQLFFASVSGSLTVTTPLLRFRRACPVSHQLRVRPHWSPASCNTVPDRKGTEAAQALGMHFCVRRVAATARTMSPSHPARAGALPRFGYYLSPLFHPIGRFAAPAAAALQGV